MCIYKDRKHFVGMPILRRSKSSHTQIYVSFKMRWPCIAILFMVFLFLSPGASGHKKLRGSHTYALYMSKYIRPGIQTEIMAEIFENENPVNVSATMKSDDFSSSVSKVIDAGKAGTLKFEEIPLNYEGSTLFSVTVIGTDKVTGKELFRKKTESGSVVFQKKFLSIFIQTDKAIYQPFHTIKFRAVITTPDLLPFDGKVTYKLIDPDDNVILMKKNVTLENGVAGFQYKLGRYSTIGLWKVSYTVHGYEEKLSAQVQEYKLPKFKTEIELDQTYLHQNSSVLSGRFFAKYTFGELVKGIGRLEITFSQSYYIQSYIIRKYEITGGASEFSVPVRDILKAVGWENWYYDLQIYISASVTEKNTMEKQDAPKSKITVHKERIKVDIVSKPEHFKPGLPYRAFIKVTEQDGALLSDEETRQTKVNVSVTYREKNFRKKIYTLDLAKDGTATLDITLEDVKDSRIYFVARVGELPDNRYTSDWGAQRFVSPSDTFLQISTTKTSYSVGDSLVLEFYSTEIAEKYTLMVIARGKVVLKESITTDEYKPGSKDGSSYRYSHEFPVTNEMAPSIDVVISFTREDGEIVADGRRFIVQATLQNTVSISTSTNKTNVGTDVTITVNTAPGSFVGLRAIDQRVLLLRKGNDITQEKIFSDLSKYGTSSGNNYRFRDYNWGWRYWISAEDVSQVFEKSGMLVMTDALVYSRTPTYNHRGLASQRIIGGRGFRSGGSSQRGSGETVVTRSRFPESWIWADSYTGDNGSTTFTYNTPDTITTWELSSFGISTASGLGVTKENSKITVFRKFFILLDLPPSMVRGEILNMRTTIFNYHDKDVMATVTLGESEWHDFQIVGEDPIAAGPVRDLLVPSKDSVTVVFPIKFVKSGQAKIFVSAKADVDVVDAIERTLVVKPEGIPETVSHNLLIDRMSDKEPPTVHAIGVKYPEDAVAGSAWAKFSVSGNILGNSLSNLGSLLRMPGGCGEQTMAAFAPDIYITLYLQRAEKLTKEIAEKSSSHIRHGYQNMLRYQHSDGSFSAFGSSDKSGSTWLTAFVMKCFIAATKLNDDFVENKQIDKMVTFILKQQQEDGSFYEPGRVISWNIQGGVESNETMAAYIIIALMEENFYTRNKSVSSALTKAQKYLEGRINHVDDIYTLSVMGYALTLLESPRVVEVMELIESRSIKSGDERFWEEKVIGASRCTDWYCRYYGEDNTASSVEMTSYVLLTYVKSNQTSNLMMPVTRWLIGRRGAFGGYYSTQDTVMGIQALSEVAALFANRTLDLDIAVTHDADDNFGSHFTVTPENSTLLQSSEVPAVAGEVSVRVEGKGVSDVQLVVSYNLPTGPRRDDPFVVNLTTNEEDGAVKLSIEATINEEREEVLNETGMFVITVELISGYTIDDEDATEKNKDARLIELVGEVVTGYFDNLTKGEKVKMDLMLTSYAKITEAKPKLIKAFDYYNPERKAIRQYSLTKTGGVCQVCGTDCVGCPEPPMRGGKEKQIRSYCKEADFPCPGFFNGLYYDPTSQVEQRMKLQPSATKRSCSFRGQRARSSQKYPGPPGTFINGSVQSIDCSVTGVFKEALDNRKGFSIAMLLYPTERTPRNDHILFSIRRPEFNQITLQLMRVKREYKIKLNLDGYEFTSTYDVWFMTSGFPVEVWTHIMLVFRGGPYADFYVNNRKVDASTTAKWEVKEAHIPNEDYVLTIGNPGSGKKGFEGLVSSLDFWKRPLNDKQVQNHYQYYFDMMFEKDPLFTEGQARHVVPKSLWSCLKPTYMRASELKVRVGEKPTLCEEEMDGYAQLEHPR